MLIALHKPYGVLCQFTPDQPGQRTLAGFGLPPRVYAIGRLDMDSEGLLLLSDEPAWNDRLLNPRNAHPRTYHVQVDGSATDEALRHLEQGLSLKDGPTLPCRACRLDPAPAYPPRDPPVRFRKSIPTSWVEITLTEGRNRQVRRMTAAVGFPTLRLIRVAIGRLRLSELHLDPGRWAALDRPALDLVSMRS